MMTIQDLIKRLEAFPPDCQVRSISTSSHQIMDNQGRGLIHITVTVEYAKGDRILVTSF